jgi:hypothetical protein
MKYSPIIHNNTGVDKIIVEVVNGAPESPSSPMIIQISFDRKQLQLLGNRYNNEGYISDESKEIDNFLTTILAKVQSMEGLTKTA